MTWEKFEGASLEIPLNDEGRESIIRLIEREEKAAEEGAENGDDNDD